MEGRELEAFVTVIAVVGIIIAILSAFKQAREEDKYDEMERKRLEEEDRNQTMFRDEEPEEDNGQQPTQPG